MRVPLLDLSEQYRLLAEPLRREFDEIIASQSFILGQRWSSSSEHWRSIAERSTLSAFLQEQMRSWLS
jgi:hypothetical protein